MPTTRRTTRTGRTTARTTSRTTGKTTPRTTSRTTTGRTVASRGRTTRSTGRGSTTTTTMRGTGRTTTPTSWSPSQFGDVRQDIQWRMSSYNNIYSQVSGPGKVTTFSPTTATRWANYVKKGSPVYKFTSTQLTKVFGKQWTNQTSPTVTTRMLRQKYGTKNIKAVAHGRGTTWLVATSSPLNQGPFRNYKW